MRNANQEQVEIAQFWDCNPNASYHSGHVLQFQQKISPGAHWMLIASLASRRSKLSLLERSRVFTYVSIVLADGFISCWNEKYRTVVIRPETFINSYIDKDWRPILQTPAFPEYTSGHSVVSAASANMLTWLLGDGFEFDDTTEVEYGLPVRSFKSFNQAAEEAAISRLYGGIITCRPYQTGLHREGSCPISLLAKYKNKTRAYGGFWWAYLPYCLLSAIVRMTVPSKTHRRRVQITYKVIRLVGPERSNVTFSNRVRETTDFNYFIYPFVYLGGGVSVGDIDNDGLPDIYLSGNMGRNALYINEGDFKFLDITKKAGWRVSGTDGQQV